MTESRGPITRYWIDPDSGYLIERKAGNEVTHNTSQWPIYRMAIECYVMKRSQGKAHDDILGGGAWPDRTPPKARTGTPRISADTKWRTAIAYAYAEEDTKRDFRAVTNESKEAAIAEGHTYAAKLDKRDVKDLSQRTRVAHWYGLLYGSEESLPRTKELDAAAD